MRGCFGIWTVGISACALLAASGAASAADLPVKAPNIAAAPVFDWTGFYGGINLGVGVSVTRVDSPPPFDFSSHILDLGGAGFTGGVQGGYNWQFASRWVVGAEVDLGWLGIDRSSDRFEFLQRQAVITNWYATARERIGYTSGPSLFYGTGGLALVRVQNRSDLISISPFVRQTFASNSEAATGWTAGGGIETMLGGNWSAKAEYLFIDAGSQDVTNNPFIGRLSFENHFHVYRYGLNYRFGDPGVPAAALPAHNWSGLYVGGTLGVGLSQGSVTTPGAVTNADFVSPLGGADVAGSRFIGGGQVGYNWQFAPNWVVGVENDISSGINRTNSGLDRTAGGIFGFGVKTDWFATVRGRVGYSTGPALLYATGGAAFVKLTNTYTDADFNVPLVASQSTVAAGWTVGGGIEAALGQNWTAKTEYLYVDAGSQNLSVHDSFAATGSGAFTANFANRFHLFRVGMNYQFGR